ncbi:MAG TPA: hypothetical protein VMW56_01060 [Candidatus Margulisiibacteriota bacterium]|nr:hypothetical protein [Candidatus Margulisiibacteriota bacterium]
MATRVKMALHLGTEIRADQHIGAPLCAGWSPGVADPEIRQDRVAHREPSAVQAALGRRRL